MNVVAIDGPGGAGKSTVARRLAARAGLAHLDTGAMYRALTWAVLDAGIDPADAEAITSLSREARLELADGAREVTIDGRDVTVAIRGPEVSAAVSAVSAHPGVREEMVRRQRQWVADRGGAVVEGRDIGSVVFPGARLKVYLTASEEERIRRRRGEADLARRDRLDSTRAASPLTVADGSVVIDTTDLGVEEIVDRLMSAL
ncbi:MAG: (d)CMP kinase [Acidimicrobiales bacterium]